MKTLENNEPITKWQKLSDNTPLNGEEALVRSNGIVYIAKFNVKHQKFILKNGKHLDNEPSQILWQIFGK